MHETHLTNKNSLGAISNFKKTLPTRLLMLAAAWDNFLRDDQNENELANLLVITDSLANSCGMYGMGEFSDSLREVEEQILEFSRPDLPDKGKMRNSIASRIQLLEQISEKDSPFDSKFKSPKTFEVAIRDIVVISSDTELIRELTIQIGHYGYNARAFSDFANFAKIAANERFVALIVDADHFPNGAAELDKVRECCLHLDPEPPMLVIASKNDFSTRLAAVRNGCHSFFGKPINVALLLDKMDSLIIGTNGDPYRILVVDDSVTSAKYITRTLESIGMTTQTENTPTKVLGAISEFNPDLIVMDMHMPGVDGTEVSKIIRQYESLISVPIVFLSSETNLKKQLLAMQVGADDFLTKPIDPEHLIQSISTRCKRYRSLNSLMQQDSLTGLLNHTKLKQRLTDALNKATRTKTEVSFAMIDIDKFKSVNDTYGHPVGDKVIKSLSRLLQRRLRKSDIIGRYGGEEFAVVFWDTSPHAALNVLDAIRNDFSKIEQFADNNQIFYCTFSAGIASAPTFSDPAELNNEADKALYISKHGGRNQITIAPDCR